MQSLQLTGIAVAAWVGTTLLGCGDKPDAYNPQSVPEAWANHFNAFGEQDLNKIMLDYDDSSVLEIYNDGCGGSHATYVGTEQIRAVLDSMFTELEDPSSTEVFSFAPKGANPVVEPDSGLDATANVFLVWRNTAGDILQATETFLWKEGYKIDRQNMAFYGFLCGWAAASDRTDRVEGNARRLTAENTQNGWDNHFAAFGTKNVSRIMLDYLSTSIVRVYDYTTAKYDTFTGLAEIEGMFIDLFAAITAAGDGVSSRVVTVKERSVFLVWSSYSHTRATDTFLFDDDGKIVRQNIVVQSNPPPPFKLAQALV